MRARQFESQTTVPPGDVRHASKGNVTIVTCARRPSWIKTLMKSVTCRRRPSGPICFTLRRNIQNKTTQGLQRRFFEKFSGTYIFTEMVTSFTEQPISIKRKQFCFASSLSSPHFFFTLSFSHFSSTFFPVFVQNV